MFKFKQSLIAFAALLAVVSLIGLVTPLLGQGQGGANQHPLNVSVVNTAAEPALVRDVGVPIRTPVQIRVNVFMSFGETNATEGVFTVPAGKRLVIEHVALDTENLLAGNAVRGRVLTEAGGHISSHPFDVHPQAPVDGPLFLANHSLLAFADPETVVTVTAEVDQPQFEGSGGYSVLVGTLSGYLENLP